MIPYQPAPRLEHGAEPLTHPRWFCEQAAKTTGGSSDVHDCP
jgi:hypothetical protein